jgi:hypothetical protein
MNVDVGRERVAFLWFISLLLLAGLACAQAGEVLSPEEATARVQGAIEADTRTDVESDIAIGDVATLTGSSFLVNIFSEPGGRIIAGQERGARVSVVRVVERDGDVWYQIEAPAGNGWVSARSLEPLPAEEAEDEEAGEETEAAAGDADIVAGDEVYLTAVGFLADIYDQPGGRLIANQERGAQVTVLSVTEEGGVTWYQIDAPTGQGWVPEENITTEPPQ